MVAEWSPCLYLTLLICSLTGVQGWSPLSLQKTTVRHCLVFTVALGDEHRELFYQAWGDCAVGSWHPMLSCALLNLGVGTEKHLFVFPWTRGDSWAVDSSLVSWGWPGPLPVSKQPGLSLRPQSVKWTEEGWERDLVGSRSCLSWSAGALPAAP